VYCVTAITIDLIQLRYGLIVHRTNENIVTSRNAYLRTELSKRQQTTICQYICLFCS